MAKWLESYDKKLLIDMLLKIRTFKEDGKPVFVGFESQEYITILHSAIKFSDLSIPEVEKWKILNKAIFQVFKNPNVTTRQVIGAISRFENDWIKSPFNSYTVMTGISIQYNELLSSIKIGDNRIVFSKSPPKHFIIEEELSRRIKSNIRGNELPAGHTIVRITTTGRSENEAVDRGMYKLDLLRGIWNMVLSSRMRISYGSREPVNSILLGPVQTLHNRDGSLASKSFWLEHGYIAPNKNWRIKDDIWERVREHDLKIRRKLGRCAYQEQIDEAIVRYTRALDMLDFHSAFLELWGVLEQLTDLNKRSNEIAIKRVSFLYKDREFHKQVLKHLVYFRNQSVHLGKRSELIESLLYQLKNYVERLILFHIFNKVKFQSIKAATEFMDLPGNIGELNKKIQLFGEAKKFRQE